MSRSRDRIWFAVAGAIGVALIAVLAGIVRAGPLEPTAAPGPTDAVKLPGTPISALPFTINDPGHYYLTRDLGINSAHAIIVNAADVSIDLGGFTLSGNDSGAGNGININSAAADRLTVENGTIRDFGTGIFGLASDDARYRNLTLYSNSTGVVLGVGGVISGCVARENVDGVYIAGNFVVVRDCVITGSLQRGVVVNDGLFSGLIERTRIETNNTFSNANGGGIMSDGNRLTVRDSSFSYNAVRDIHLTGDDNVMIDNVFHCPGRVTLVAGATNNFFPTNTTDPHTNRTVQTAC